MVTVSFDAGGAGGLPVTCVRALTAEASKNKIASFCQNWSTICLSPSGERALQVLIKISGEALWMPHFAD